MSQRNYPRRLIPFLNFPENLEARPAEQGLQRKTSRRHCGLLLAMAAALVVLGAGAAQGSEKTLNQQGRIRLIRGLDREIAVAKVSLPLGKHGIFVDEKGQVDQERAKEEFRTYGTAVTAGMPVEITKIKFKPHQIVFEINNGGKQHKKWYQRIQVGMGGMTQPVVQGQDTPVAMGSSITLTFQDEKVPDLTVAQTKKLLGKVLDFHRQTPTELYSPSIPKKFKQAIKKHQVLVGMNRDAVLSSKGPPFRKVRETKPNGDETEDWLYGLPPHVLFVTFDGDTVVKVHQY